MLMLRRSHFVLVKVILLADRIVSRGFAMAPQLAIASPSVLRINFVVLY
jgi:hypothetical protein